MDLEEMLIKVRKAGFHVEITSRIQGWGASLSKRGEFTSTAGSTPTEALTKCMDKRGGNPLTESDDDEPAGPSGAHYTTPRGGR